VIHVADFGPRSGADFCEPGHVCRADAWPHIIGMKSGHLNAAPHF
jgi:hypothetical protein